MLPPQNKLPNYFTSYCCFINFQLLENKRKEQSDSRQRQWLALPKKIRCATAENLGKISENPGEMAFNVA